MMRSASVLFLFAAVATQRCAGFATSQGKHVCFDDETGLKFVMHIPAATCKYVVDNGICASHVTVSTKYCAKSCNLCDSNHVTQANAASPCKSKPCGVHGRCVPIIATPPPPPHGPGAGPRLPKITVHNRRILQANASNFQCICKAGEAGAKARQQQHMHNML